MSDEKFKYENRFFLSDDRADVSCIACNVYVNMDSERESNPWVSMDGELVLFDGYNRTTLSFSDGSYLGDETANREKFVRNLLALRDCCNTMLEKMEEATQKYEKLEKKIRKE